MPQVLGLRRLNAMLCVAARLRVVPPPAVRSRNGLKFIQNGPAQASRVTRTAMEDIVDFQEWLRAIHPPHWVEDRSPDAEHPHRRRFTLAYRRKKRIVKNVWIASGLVMIVRPPRLSLPGCCWAPRSFSFVILDETR